jgi:ABC-type ATPase with predicted acetyltransferase domain
VSCFALGNEGAAERISVAASSDNYPNDVLRQAFQQLNRRMVETMDSDAIVDILFEEAVISGDENLKLSSISDRQHRTRNLLATLHASKNSQVFVSLRRAMMRDETCKQLAHDIDRLCSQMTATGVDVTGQGVNPLGNQLSRLTIEAISVPRSSAVTGNFLGPSVALSK